MAQEEFESPHAEPEQRAARLRMIGTPLAATLRTFWLLISSLARLTVRWLSHAPATAVVTVALSVLSASYLVWRSQALIVANSARARGRPAAISARMRSTTASRPWPGRAAAATERWRS